MDLERGVASMTSALRWKPVAWNGVRLEIPASWDPARIGRRFLMLEDAEGPRLALRWEPIRGRFDPERTLRKLTRAVDADADVATADVLPSWRKALKSAAGPQPEISGFRWRDGRGALLHWPDANAAVLVGFYGKSPPPAAGPALASLRIVVRKPTRAFILYDIQARVPADLNLDRFQFLPGAFELAFSGTGTRLRLHRWGPASMLLDEGGLADFARRRISSAPGSAAADGDALVWEIPVGGPLGAILPGKRPRFEAGRLWRLPEPDRILGAVAAAPSRDEAKTLRDRVARDFGIVDANSPNR